MSCVSHVLVISLHSTSHVTVMISQCVIVLPGMCVTVECQIYCLKGLGTGTASVYVVLCQRVNGLESGDLYHLGIQSQIKLLS